MCLKLLAVKRTFFIDFELFKLELQVKKSNYTLSHMYKLLNFVLPTTGTTCFPNVYLTRKTFFYALKQV